MNKYILFLIAVFFVVGLTASAAPSLQTTSVEGTEKPDLVGLPYCSHPGEGYHFSLATNFWENNNENYPNSFVVEESEDSTGPCNNGNISWTQFNVHNIDIGLVGFLTVNGDTDEVSFEAVDRSTDPREEDVNNESDLVEPVPDGSDDGVKQSDDDDDKMRNQDDDDDSDDDDDDDKTKTVHLILTADEEDGEVEFEFESEGDRNKFKVKGKVYVRAGFVKLGDIKGESDDSADHSGEGKVEFEWKVEEGESAAKTSKPKEIVVVGSKARELDKASPKLFEAITKGEVVTEADLESFMTQLASGAPEEVQELVSTTNGIQIAFKQRARFLGFIPLNLRSELHVGVDSDELGKVKVRFPWYGFLASKTVKSHDLVTQVEESLSETEFSQWTSTGFETGDTPTESFTFNFSEIKATFFDTAMAVIRNLR